jgi:hypothetical protein
MLWRSGHEDLSGIDGHEDEHFVNFAHKALHTAMNPMNKVNSLSPTLKNVLNLVFQYYVVFVIFQTIRSYNQVIGNTSPSGKAWEKVFEACMSTVALCPMLAILFIGTRLR